MVYRRPVLELESAAEAPPVVDSTQLKSPTQLPTAKPQEVEPPKLQVLPPAKAGVAVAEKVDVPAAGKLMEVMLTVLLPAGMVNAPEFGSDAVLPAAASVPGAAPVV